MRDDAYRPATPLDELVHGDHPRHLLDGGDGKSGARVERVVLDGEPYVLKWMHVDSDWIQRGAGDVRCYPAQLWKSGFFETLPSFVDPAVVGVVEGVGRNGWGAVLVMRDVSPWLVPPSDEPISFEQHRRFLDHMAGLCAAFWGWQDTRGTLLPYGHRWRWFGVEMLEVERARGWENPIPPLAAEGWARFLERAPGDVAEAVAAVRREPHLLAEALRRTPSTFLQGDWKLGNVGSHPDGTTILLDWAGPGEGPACHDLGWYLALNRARLPEPKEDAIAAFRRSLEQHGVATDGWWDEQLALALLGVVVIFGWEKALGDDEELGWWADRAREGARRL